MSIIISLSYNIKVNIIILYWIISVTTGVFIIICNSLLIHSYSLFQGFREAFVLVFLNEIHNAQFTRIHVVWNDADKDNEEEELHDESHVVIFGCEVL